MTDIVSYALKFEAMRANKKRYEAKYGKMHAPIASYEVLRQGCIRGRFTSKKDLKEFLESGKGNFNKPPHLYPVTIRGYDVSGTLVYEKEDRFWASN